MKRIFEVFHAGPADVGRFHVVARTRQEAKQLACANYPEHQVAVFPSELIRTAWRYDLLMEWQKTL